MSVPKLLRPIQWRWSAGREHVEIFDEGRQAWFKYHPWTADVLEGIGEARGVEEHEARLVASRRGALSAEQARKMVRNFLFELRQAGAIDLGWPAPPEKFHERYRVEKELGRGAVGAAWLCLDEATNERVVVKQPWSYFASLSTAESFLRREAAVMREIDDARVVRLLDSFEEDGVFHAVRAFVDGEKLPLGHLTRDLAVSLADVIGAVHAAGFLLLDAHPGNFLVTKSGPVLIDVGLAERAERGSARVDKALGGRGFVAPEIRANKVADARSDVWGFGRLLFAISTGVMPQEWSEASLAKRLEVNAARELVLALCRDDPSSRPADMAAARELSRSTLSA